MSRPIRFLSLGAGVQSSTILFLALHGEIPPIDFAVFADTQNERSCTYDHLAWMEREIGDRIPIVRVTAGNLLDKWWQMPLYTGTDADEDEGKISRNCSRDFKVAPVRRHVRPIYLAQPKPRPPLQQLMGFSQDEYHRASDSQVQYIVNAFPLLYERPMTKGDCLVWLTEHGYPEPPKSACIPCSLRSDNGWADLTPEEMAEAVTLDEEIRHGEKAEQWRGVATPFLHRRGALASVTLRPRDIQGDQLGLGLCEPGAGCFT